MIKKNELLDSLDLNVGMDALMKLQDVWGKAPRKNSKKLEPLAAAPVPVNPIALNKIDMVKTNFPADKPKPINEVYTKDEFEKLQQKAEEKKKIQEPEDEDSM